MCSQGRIDCAGLRCVFGYESCVRHCRRAAAMLSRHATRFAQLARELNRVLAADWFRLDVFFTGSDGRMLINELSYPSHLERNASQCCSFARLVDAYEQRAYQTADATTTLTGVMHRAGLLTRAQAARFLRHPDYLSMLHPADATYERQLWQWSPGSRPDRFEHRSDSHRHAKGNRTRRRKIRLRSQASR